MTETSISLLTGSARPADPLEGHGRPGQEPAARAGPTRDRLRGPVVFLPGVLALFLAGGCGDRYGGRRAVSGTVTFQGKPLDQGSITFVPASPDLSTQSGAGIRDGHYQIPRAQGLVPGKYKVSISSGDPGTPADPSAGPPGPSGNYSSKERIPPRYNVRSTLEVEVQKGGPNEFDFTIP